MENTKECLALCPYCGNEHIDYKAIEVEGEMIYYPADCLSCGKSFKEWYNISYNETTFE